MRTIVKTFIAIIFVASVSCLCADAAWYNFASQEGVPEINELRVGPVSLESLPDLLVLSADDLEGGKLVFRGKADIYEGTIGAVFISFDGGENWEKVNFSNDGSFNYEFTPVTAQEYKVCIKAVATTGKTSDYESDIFPIMVSNEHGEDEVRRVFNSLLKSYMNEDQTTFMSFVSDDFEGDLGALEDAIDDDMRFFENIVINPTISRVVKQGAEYELYFTFYRRLENASSGGILTDSSSSFMRFKKNEDGVKLVAMAAPLIFGVSNTEEVATTVDGDSVGQEVIVVNSDTGQASKVTQQDTVEETVGGEVVEGSETLTCEYDLAHGDADSGEGFSFESQSISDDTSSDVRHGNQDADLRLIMDPKLIPVFPV
ncbi:MAG: hypothetical protein HQL29_02490 [Candidatus Omnitrophica bacterium]|nr:hypothetical protein [Candidatus Omnitrophota bacterium]